MFLILLKHPFRQKKTDQGLRVIRQTLEQQNALLNFIKKSLPEPLKEQCLHVTFNDKTVTLYTSSPVWASRLLFYRTTILDALSQKKGDRCHRFNVKVLKPSTPNFVKKPRKPSRKTVGFLKTANTFNPSNKLNASMTQLIQALEKKS